MCGKARKICFLACCLLATFGNLRGQNLIPNPGFEHFRRCPRFLGNLEADLIGWDTPTRGSTDYFNSCSEHMGTPENFNGEQRAAEGNGYAGFYAYAPGDYREYLQVRLAGPLDAGRQYRIRFYVSLAERSDYALHSLGLLFTEAPLKVATKKNLARRLWFENPGNRPHYLEVSAPVFFTDTENWTRVDTVFTAKGTEQVLLIGNFLPNARTRTLRTGRRSNKGAYYYMDRVSLEPLGAGEASPDYDLAGRFPTDSLLALPAMLFEFDTYRLSETGRYALSDLYRVLAADSSLHLELRGHTDSLGGAGYNRILSERRCEAVASFLRQKGMDPERVRWKGYGDTQPLAGNRTAEGRRRNRRVEFLLSRNGKLLPSGN